MKFLLFFMFGRKLFAKALILLFLFATFSYYKNEVFAKQIDPAFNQMYYNAITSFYEQIAKTKAVFGLNNYSVTIPAVKAQGTKAQKSHIEPFDRNKWQYKNFVMPSTYQPR